MKKIKALVAWLVAYFTDPEMRRALIHFYIGFVIGMILGIIVTLVGHFANIDIAHMITLEEHLDGGSGGDSHFGHNH